MENKGSIYWDSVKRKAKISLADKLNSPNGETLSNILIMLQYKGIDRRDNIRQTQITTIKIKLYKTIDKWDIRCCQRLIDLFPKNMPDFVKNKNFTLWFDENQEWILLEK